MPRKAFLKNKSLLDRFKDDYAMHTGYIQSARAEHTWNNPLTRRKRTKELNKWIKSFAGKDHIHKLARFNATNAGRYESMYNEAMSLKGFLENLTEKLTKQFNLDVEKVQAYLDSHTQEMQELLDDKDLSLKEKVLFVRSEITGEKDEKKSESISVHSLIIPPNDDTWADVPDDYYPEQVACDICEGTYDDVVMNIVNSNILHKSFVVCDDCVSVAKEILEKEEHKLNKGRGYESKKSERFTLNFPVVVYKGDAENAAKAHDYLYKKMPRVKGASISSDVKPLGNNKFCRVLFYGNNTGVMDLFAYYSNLYNDDFWNNCDADPQGWVDPLTIARYDVATPRQESKKHEGFNTTRDLNNFALHILNYIKDKTHYPGYVRFVKLNDDEEDFYGKYFLSVNGKNYYLYVGDTDYSITDNNDENTLVEGSTDLSGAMQKDLNDFCERITQPFYTESKEPADEKLGYEKGHKNSRGEDAPWVIRSHEDNRILASFAKKTDAEEHLQRMKQYSKQESKSADELDKYIKDVKSLLKSKYGMDFNDKDTCRLNVGWLEKLDAMFYQGKPVEDGAKEVAAFCGYNKDESKKSEDLESYACYIDFGSEDAAKDGMKLVNRWNPLRNGTAVMVDGIGKNAANSLWKDWLDQCIKAGLDIMDNGEVYKEEPSCIYSESKKSERQEDGENSYDDYWTLIDGLKALGFEPSSHIRNGMIYPYRTHFTATKDGIKYVFILNEDRTGEYLESIEVFGGIFDKGDPNDPNPTRFKSVNEVLDALKKVGDEPKKSEDADDVTYELTEDAVTDLIKELGLEIVNTWYDGNKDRIVYDCKDNGDENGEIVCVWVEPPYEARVWLKDANPRVNQLVEGLETLDALKAALVDILKIELGESHVTESLRKPEDTIIVPNWLWETYTLGENYDGDTLTDDEQQTYLDFKEKYEGFNLKAVSEKTTFRSDNDFDSNGCPCYEVNVFKN